MPSRGQLKRKRFAAIIIGALLFSAIFYWLHPASKPLRQAANGVAQQFFGGLYHFSNGTDAGSKKTVADYQKTTAELSQQVADLAFQVSSLELLRQENERLQSLLAYQPPKDSKRIVARVFGSDPMLNNSLIISAGSDSGVALGDAVITGEGTLIGTIAGLKSSSSTVLLLTDNQVRVAVSRLGETKSLGVSKGTFGLGIIVDFIPQNEAIVEGDIVATAGLDQHVPSGLVIGKVNRITSTDNELFKQISVLPFVDYQQVTTVAVLHSELLP